MSIGFDEEIEVLDNEEIKKEVAKMSSINLDDPQIKKNADDEENIRKLCLTVITEYLHQPSKKLKDISKNVECDLVVGTVQNMFDLNNDSNFAKKYKCDHLSKN